MAPSHSPNNRYGLTRRQWLSFGALALALMVVTVVWSNAYQNCIASQDNRSGNSLGEKVVRFSVALGHTPRCVGNVIRVEHDTIIAIATVGLLFVTGALAIYTALLWKTTVGLAEDAEMAAHMQGQRTDAAIAQAVRSADAATATVAKMDEIAQRQLRAYVGVRPGEFKEQHHGVNFKMVPILKNSGQTPAYDVAASLRVRVSDYLIKDEEFVYRDVDLFRIGIIGPQQEIVQNLWADEYYPEDVIAKLKPTGGKWVYIYGSISYRDAFDQNRVTKFCYWVNRGLGSVPDSWTVHAFYNGAT